MMGMLGDYLEILGGGTPSRDVEAYWNGDLPWATVKDLTTKRISETYESITQRGADECATNIVPANTLLISTRMALGRMSITDVPMAFNQDLKALKITGAIDQDYLFHFLSSKEAYFISRGNGATVKGFKVDDIRSLPFDPPPLPTQRHIAAVLDKAQALVANDRRTLAVYDQLAKSLFLEMFGDPVRNERGWEVNTIGEVAENKDNLRVPVKMSDREGRQGKYPYYGASGIIDYVDEFIYSGPNLLIGEDGANLVARSTPIAFIAEGEYWVNNHAHVLGFNGRAVLRYLEAFINSIDLEPYVTGSAQPKLTRSKMDAIEVPIPPMELQKKYMNTLDRIDGAHAQAKTSLRRSEGLFGSLLQSAFAGGFGG